MNKHILPKFLITAVTILCVFCSVDLLFAREEIVSPQANADPYSLQAQARQYREEGLKSQKLGNLSEAKSWYEKAITLDPNYAVVYNDLGVIYEAEGSLGKAEESYLMAVKIDPTYSSAYTNLALFYENKRNLEKAEFYWTKRTGLGSPDDPWTQEAVNRLKKIHPELYNRPSIGQREEGIAIPIKEEVTVNKAISTGQREEGAAGLMDDTKELARGHLQEAKQSFNRGDLATAIKEALDAQQLDQNNKETQAFIEKAMLRNLSR